MDPNLVEIGSLYKAQIHIPYFRQTYIVAELGGKLLQREIPPMGDITIF